MNKEAFDKVLTDAVSELQKRAASDPFSTVFNATFNNPIGDSIRGAVNMAVSPINPAARARTQKFLRPYGDSGSGNFFTNPFGSMVDSTFNNPIGKSLIDSWNTVINPFGKRPPGYGKPGLDRGGYSSPSDFRRSVEQAGRRPPGYGKPGLDRGGYSSPSDFRRSVEQAGARERAMQRTSQRAIESRY